MVELSDDADQDWQDLFCIIPFIVDILMCMGLDGQGSEVSPSICTEIYLSEIQHNPGRGFNV
jgi:hypothetical protein